VLTIGDEDYGSDFQDADFLREIPVDSYPALTEPYVQATKYPI